MIVNDELIVLRTRKFGDSSKIVSAFGKSVGKVGLLAKGARKPRSRFAGSLEPTGILFASYYQKTSRSLQLLSKAESLKSFRNLRNSLERLSCALSALELVDKTQEESDPNPDLYDSIVEFLGKFDVSTDPFAELSRFALRYAKTLGFAADFGEKIAVSSSENVFFLFEKGVFSSVNSAENGAYFTMTADAYEFLRSIAEYESIELDRNGVAKIIAFFERFFSFYAEKKIKLNSAALMI